MSWCRSEDLEESQSKGSILCRVIKGELGWGVGEELEVEVEVEVEGISIIVMVFIFM